MSRPARGRAIVAFGLRSNAAVEAAGPMKVAPKLFWKPIVESATPTDEGFVSEVWRVR